MAAIGILVALAVAAAWSRLHRAVETISDEAMAKAVTRERLHRERLELPPADAAMAHRIADGGRFLRGRRIA
jgi:hypothetical protein